MKLALSTLTCPDWSLDKICRTMKELNIGMIDFRGLMGKKKLWETEEFSEDNRERTLKQIRQYGITVSGISTSVKLFPTTEESTWADMFDEGKRSIDLCRKCGGWYIRVMGGFINRSPHKDKALETLISNYRELCQYAQSQNVSVLIETHDHISSSTGIVNVLDRLNHASSGAIWDVRHPLHLEGENFETTLSIMGSYIRVVHVKDFSKTEGFPLMAFGEGDFDAPACVQALETVGYGGLLVLEQPKIDSTGKPAPDKNITGFARTMNPLIEERESQVIL